MLLFSRVRIELTFLCNVYCMFCIIHALRCVSISLCPSPLNPQIPRNSNPHDSPDNQRAIVSNLPRRPRGSLGAHDRHVSHCDHLRAMRQLDAAGLESGQQPGIHGPLNKPLFWTRLSKVDPWVIRCAHFSSPRALSIASAVA